MSVDTDLVEPFLPPGERVHRLEDEAGAIIWSREVSVDGEDVFGISRESWEPGWSTRRFAVGHAYVGPEHEATDNSQVCSGGGAAVTVRCTDRGSDRDVFLVAEAEENSAGEKAMEEFIVAYREELMRSDPCAGR